VTREEALSQLYALVAPPPGGSTDSVSSLQREAVRVTGPPSASDGSSAEGSAEGVVSRSRLSDQLVLITQQLDLLRTVQQTQADLLGQNTRAVSENTTSSVASAAKGVGSALLGGFGVSPIVSGLLKLFGGGSASTPAEQPVVKYAAPETVRIDAGLIGGRDVAAVDRGASDRVRVLGGNTGAAAATQVTVQVNAMDSRSFLDRSDEIAKAVRLAMLESHSINDVVAEL
jgi:hypothetical protein